MNYRYGAITTAALAAFVLGVTPAMAQISKGLDPYVGAGANVGTGKGEQSPGGKRGAERGHEAEPIVDQR